MHWDEMEIRIIEVLNPDIDPNESEYLPLPLVECSGNDEQSVDYTPNAVLDRNQDKDDGDIDF